MERRATVEEHAKDTADTAERVNETESFVFEQKSLYSQELGKAIEKLLREAAERAFKRDLWILDQHFLDHIDALSGDIRARATIYYGISQAANRTLLQELSRHLKHLQSGLDVVRVQFNENALALREPPRYQRSVTCTLEKLEELEKKLARTDPDKRYTG